MTPLPWYRSLKAVPLQMLSPETLLWPTVLFEPTKNPPQTIGPMGHQPDYEFGSSDSDSGIFSLGTLGKVSFYCWSTVCSQAQSHTQPGKLWWERAPETEGKTGDSIQDEGLLGLKRRESRSGDWMGCTLLPWTGRELLIWGKETDTMCFTRKDHFHVTSTPRNKTLVEELPPNKMFYC